MTHSYLLDTYTRRAVAPGRFYFTRRLPAAVALLVVLSLAAGFLPGTAGRVHAQENTPPPVAAAVNINKADAATLASGLTGVGASRAEEIVRYRETYGPFKSVEELADVKGIGKSTLETNRARITLE